MKLNSSIAVVVAVGAALLVGTAFAGSKFTGNGSVVIAKKADGSGQATGMLGHIYNAPTLNEFIACQKSVTGNLYCQARNEANVHVACTTNSAYLANAVGALATDARVTFRWNASGLCTAISISRSSEFQDKQG